MPRSRTPAPSHLLPLAVLLLVWFGALAADYAAERFAIADGDWPGLMRVMPLDPLWLRLCWALGVWLGFAAAVFLALRDNASVLLFFAAAASWVAVAAGVWTIPAAGVALPVRPVLAALIAVPALGWLYARSLNRAGALH